MRILLLADSLGNGGLERQLALLATSLPREHERRVWAMGGGRFAGYLAQRGVDVAIRTRSWRLDPRPAAQLWQDLRAWRPDVVHSWSWMSTLAAAPACRALGLPLVDGTIQTGAYRPELFRLNRLGMACATVVVANTQAGLDAWGVDPSRGRVVYNGFDAARLDAPEGTREREPGRPFTVIMTARMEPVKHYDVVIAAARQLAREGDGWRFVLVGDGADRARLLRAAADLTETGTVVFPEPTMEVLDLVRQADVGVLMTNPALASEGLSNSIMEYMAFGLPVICGNGGGNPELVLDGVTGFIVPQGDPDRLAERLAYLREHADARRDLGAAGRARIAGEFSVEAMVERMLAVYTEARERRGARRR